MTIKQFCVSEQGDWFLATPAERHAERALEQAARFAADVAIARWSGVDGYKAVLDARAGWLAKAQDGLKQWLDGGGFAQGEDAGVEVPAADAPLTFPGTRPLFYTLFRQARSTAS